MFTFNFAKLSCENEISAFPETSLRIIKLKSAARFIVYLSLKPRDYRPLKTTFPRNAKYFNEGRTL